LLTLLGEPTSRPCYIFIDRLFVLNLIMAVSCMVPRENLIYVYWIRYRTMHCGYASSLCVQAKYLKTYSTLANSSKTVILCWIPGHVGISGNKKADRVAKAALSLPISPVKVSVTDFLPHAKLRTCSGYYQTEWFTRSKRCRNYQPATDWSHAHLLGDDDEAVCTSLTVNHILIKCPQFNHLRQQYQ